jgi:hypothetical protein
VAGSCKYGHEPSGSGATKLVKVHDCFREDQSALEQFL